MCIHLVRPNMQMSLTMDITNLQKFKNRSNKGLETGAQCTNFLKNIAYRMIMGRETPSWTLQFLKFLPAFELLNKLNLKSQLGKLAVSSFFEFLWTSISALLVVKFWKRSQGLKYFLRDCRSCKTVACENLFLLNPTNLNTLN